MDSRTGGGGGGMRMGSSWRWQLTRAIRLALRWCRVCCPRRASKGGGFVKWWIYCKLLLKSLYFNSQNNSDTLLDCVFEPVYWIVDNVTCWFGVVFVSLVILLTTSVVLIVYLFVLPAILSNYSWDWVIWHLVCGHWLLTMVVFHYYKATTTPPGHPPKAKVVIPSVSFCKKCIIPKPARTHHCSICNTCVLKMDHHCRCIYCSISSKDLFLDAYGTIEEWGCSKAMASLLLLGHEAKEERTATSQTPSPSDTFSVTTAHKCVIFLWVLTSSVAVALGGLTLWHIILISRGETSVERHINRKESKRLWEIGKVFRNPYHHGKINNWKLLFGVEKRSHWFTRVLLPSGHPPSEDGIVWDYVFHRRDPMAV